MRSFIVPNYAEQTQYFVKNFFEKINLCVKTPEKPRFGRVLIPHRINSLTKMRNLRKPRKARTF
jgi:hypothetical protein